MTIAPPPVGSDDERKAYTMASASGADGELPTSTTRPPSRMTCEDGLLEMEDISMETLR